MRSRAALAMALVATLAAGAVPPAAPAAAPRCSAGATLFAADGVRIFLRRSTSAEETRWTHYACRRAQRRGTEVGRDFVTAGTASGRTLAYALGGGGRYLAAYHVDDGEGGPSAWVSVVDLRTRRRPVFANAACCDEVPPFRVLADGTLVLGGYTVTVHRPGARDAQRLSSLDVDARDLAVVGGTVYWTEAEQPRSATVGGATDRAEATLLEPARIRRTPPCPRARGTTVAASPAVRVVQRRGRRFACRTGQRRRAAAGSSTAPAPRIVADRWLLLPESVLDTRTRRTVTVFPAARAATVLADGTAAWLDESGRLLAQSPAADTPTEVAPASASPTALAAGRRTIYWTSAGTAHAFTPR